MVMLSKTEENGMMGEGEWTGFVAIVDISNSLVVRKMMTKTIDSRPDAQLIKSILFFVFFVCEILRGWFECKIECENA